MECTCVHINKRSATYFRQFFIHDSKHCFVSIWPNTCKWKQFGDWHSLILKSFGDFKEQSICLCMTQRSPSKISPHLHRFYVTSTLHEDPTALFHPVGWPHHNAKYMVQMSNVFYQLFYQDWPKTIRDYVGNLSFWKSHLIGNIRIWDNCHQGAPYAITWPVTLVCVGSVNWPDNLSP